AMNASPVPTGWSPGMQNTITSTSESGSRTPWLGGLPRTPFGLFGAGGAAGGAGLPADQGVGQRRLPGVGAAHQGDEAAAVRRLLRAAHASSLPPGGDGIAVTGPLPLPCAAVD